MTEKSYRPGVVAVFLNHAGQVLLGKRWGLPDAWQFPQGGIDAGETPEEALRREVWEEIGCEHFEILKQAGEPIAYEFPENLASSLAAHYRGQKLYWFLCRVSENCAPDLAKARDQEFDELRWWPPIKAVEFVVAWKKQAYRQGLQALGIDH